jgi:hypothetical protein
MPYFFSTPNTRPKTNTSTRPTPNLHTFISNVKFENTDGEGDGPESLQAFISACAGEKVGLAMYVLLPIFSITSAASGLLYRR